MTYQDIIDKWGEFCDRNELSFEEELDYIWDWYQAGETLPTKPFEANFSDYKKYDGQNFTIVGPVTYAENDVDIECLPMWEIKFDAGDTIWATCDEIFNFNDN